MTMDFAVAIFVFAMALGFFLFFLTIIIQIFRDKIRVDGLLAEVSASGAKASLSRFQLLVFTFVTAGLFLVLSIEAGQMFDIPNGVLGLLGISGGSYVTAKAVK